MSDRRRGFLHHLVIESGRSLGRGIGLILGVGVVGAGAGAIGAVIYGAPIATGAVIGLAVVAGIALFIFLAGQFL